MRHEPADEIGLNSALASMLSEGTESYSSKKLAEEIERLGASLSAQVQAQTIRAFPLRVCRFMFPTFYALWQKLVLKPTFPESELNLYQTKHHRRLKVSTFASSFLADEQIAKILYGSHPYSIVSPTAEDVEKIIA